MKKQEGNPWYRKGLRFKCTQCGKCCTGKSGYIWVSNEEIDAIAEKLGLSTKQFSMRYLRYREGRYSLIEKRSIDGYDCIFLENKKCTIYQVRPKQCKTYPWWKESLSSEKEWEQTAKACEGINPQGNLYTSEEIKSYLN